MKKLALFATFVLLALLLVLWPARAQYNGTIVHAPGTLAATGTTGGTAVNNLSGVNAGLFLLTWITSGSPTGCSIQAEGSSSVSGTYSLIGVAQTCTSNGQYQFIVAPGSGTNFIHVNLTTLSGGTSPTVTPILTALVNTPVPYAPTNMVYSTGSYTNATTSFTSVTGLAFYAAASQNYHALCRITWQGSAGTTGPKYQWTGPSTPTAVLAGLFSNITTGTYISPASATGFSSALANSGTITTATNFTDTLDLSVLNGTNAGTVQLQMAANGSGTLTVQNGSYCQVQ